MLGLAVTFIGVACFARWAQDRPVPFDKKLWDLGFLDSDHRYGMAKDLIELRALIGKSRSHVEAILGRAVVGDAPSEMFYPLRQEFDVIDPIAGNDLVLKLDSSSIVVHAEIVKWKRK